MFNLVTFGKSFITSQQSGMKDGLCLASRQERRRKQQIDQNLFHLIRPLFVFIRLQILLRLIHKPRGQIFGYFCPPPPFVVTFNKYGLCYKIVNWLTHPLPPQLSTWFMKDPLRKLMLLLV